MRPASLGRSRVRRAHLEERVSQHLAGTTRSANPSRRVRKKQAVQKVARFSGHVGGDAVPAHGILQYVALDNLAGRAVKWEAPCEAAEGEDP